MIIVQPYWVQHDPGFASLLVGRIVLAQISRGHSTGQWFISLMHCTGDEQPASSAPTEEAAHAVVMAHVEKVLSFPGYTNRHNAVTTFPLTP